MQSDLTILLEMDHPLYEQARDTLSGFAELVKSPEYIHTYRLTRLSLWNAASAGIPPEKVLEELQRFAKHDPPQIVVSRIFDWGKRYGRVQLLIESGNFILRCADQFVAAELENTKAVAKYLIRRLDAVTFESDIAFRGHIKQALIFAEYPAEDLAGYHEAEILALTLRQTTRSGQSFALRPYQLYRQFRNGEFPVIIVSKVANYAIDLPDANVAIEVSGSFGSRQEEAQRLGRILRPKTGENRAWFYTLVTSHTVEEGFAAHR